MHIWFIMILRSMWHTYLYYFFAEAKAIPYYFNKYLRKLYSKDGESEKFFCHEIFCHTIQMVNEKPHP